MHAAQQNKPILKSITEIHPLHFVFPAQPNQKFRLIDVAGGTADIAKRAISRYNIDATVCDINCSMLEEGRDIAINQNITNLKFICGDAENLPFLSNFFDCYTIAFGIRNVVNRESALREAFRVLKVGGKFICLEFSPLSDSNHLKKIYDFYSFKIIPKMGKVIANNEEAYQYLVDSIRAFPSPGEFNAEISSVGFKKNLFRQMSLGVVSIHTAWKI